jgi:large subunit ribosomal protein L24
MQKLKVKDQVVILAGKDKGKTGEVKKINFKKSLVFVAGVNVVKKAMKPTQENPAGGIVDMEAPLHISNVAVVSPKTKKATRVKFEDKNGKLVRVAVACGTELDK